MDRSWIFESAFLYFYFLLNILFFSFPIKLSHISVTYYFQCSLFSLYCYSLFNFCSYVVHKNFDKTNLYCAGVSQCSQWTLSVNDKHCIWSWWLEEYLNLKLVCVPPLKNELLLFKRAPFMKWLCYKIKVTCHVHHALLSSFIYDCL